MKWLILILGVLSNASASILIKVVMTSAGTPILVSKPLSIVSNVPLLFGLFLYGMAFVFYFFSLMHLPLNVAHPVLTSGSIALVSVASVTFFGESMSMINIFGVVLIISGVIALTIN